MNERTHFFRKIYLSQFIRKRCERVVCKRWVGDWTDCNILTPSSSDYSSTSFLILLGCSTGGLGGASPLLGTSSHCLELQRTSTATDSNWLELLWHLVIYASRERPICTEFTRPWSRWHPDIFDQMHLLFDWRLGRGSICYKNIEKIPGNLRRIVVTQPPVKAYQQTLGWKTRKKYNNNNNNKARYDWVGKVIHWEMCKKSDIEEGNLYKC